jgi:uncharacterized protein YecT (DUF1311 family)
MPKRTGILPVISMLLFVATAHAACGQDDSDEAIRACLAQDLRDSDKRINAVYKSLMELNDETGKVRLRDEQRAWLKSRDKTCKLSNKESDREKWLQSILANQDQTVCVGVTPSRAWRRSTKRSCRRLPTNRLRRLWPLARRNFNRAPMPLT